MKRLFLSVCLPLLGMAAHAQLKTSGTVVDFNDNTPLAGARVEAIGHDIHTMTGVDGHFTLETDVPVNRIKVSYIGKKTVKQDIRGLSTVVRMKKQNPYTEAPANWHLVLMGQMAFPSPGKDNAYGGMIALVKKAGVYAKVQMNSMPAKATSDRSISGWEDKDYESGYASYTGGLIFRVANPFYMYMGGGMATRRIVAPEANGANATKYNIKDESYSAGVGDVGGILKLGPLMISGGITYVFGESKVVPNAGVGLYF